MSDILILASLTDPDTVNQYCSQDHLLLNPISGKIWRCNDATNRYELQSTIAVATAQEVTQQVQVEVDFGLAEASIARAYVPAPWVQADSIIDVDPVAMANDDHDPDDVAAEGLIGYATVITPNVGFRILVRAPGQTWGRYLINVQGR